MSRTVFLIIILIIIYVLTGFLIIIRGEHTASYQWTLTTLQRTGDLFEETSLIKDVYNSENVTSLVEISEFDYPNTDDASGDAVGRFACRYYLKFTLTHNHQITTMVSQAMLQSSAPPIVTVTCPGSLLEGLQTPTQIRRSRAAPVRFQNGVPIALNTTWPANTFIQDVGWLVPLPLDHASSGVISVYVEAVTLGHIHITHRSFQVSLAGWQEDTPAYTPVLGNAVSGSPNLTGPLSAGQGIPGFNPLRTLIVNDAQGVVAVGDADFESPVLLQNGDLWGAASDVCSCDTPSRQLVPLPDRTLLVNQSGVWELRGDLATTSSDSAQSDTALETELVLAVCVKDAWMPSQPRAPQAWQLVLQGACQHEGRLYSATLHLRSAESLRFTEVLDPGGHTLCQSLSDMTPCGIATGVMTTLSGGALLVLLEDTQEYHVIKATNQQGNWTFSRQSTLPKALPTTISHHRLVSNMTFSAPTEPFQLRAMTVPCFISPCVYVWGSHLLTSCDGGHHFYQLLAHASSDPIRALTTHTSSTAVFITDSQQLWAGLVGHPEFRQIYPSSAWDLVVTPAYDQDIPDLTTATVLSLFFTHTGWLKLVYVDVSSASILRTFSVSVEDVLQQLALADQWAWHWQASSDVPSSTCVYQDITLELSSDKLTTAAKEVVTWESAPLLQASLPLHGPLSLIHWATTLHDLDPQGASPASDIVQHHRDSMERWQTATQASSSYRTHLFRNGFLTNGVYIDPGLYFRVYHFSQEVSTEFPDVLYLSYREALNFTLIIKLESGEILADIEDQITLSAVAMDAGILNVDFNKTVLYSNAMVLFEVTLTDLGTLDRRELPGAGLYPTSVQLTLGSAPLQCFTDTVDKVQHQGSYNLDLLVGCPPSQRVQFDHTSAWETLRSMNIKPFDCKRPHPEYPCMYYDHDFFPFFDLFDAVSGTWTHFNDTYTLKIVGGSPDSVESLIEYTEDQIFEFNNKMASGDHLIWDSTKGLEHTEDGWLMFSRENNSLSWLCQSNSPCENVLPSFPDSPDFYFLLELENTETPSYCNYSMRFVLHIHGLPISGIGVSLPLVFGSVVMNVIAVAIYAWYFFRDSCPPCKCPKLVQCGHKVQPTTDDPDAETDPVLEDLINNDDWRTILEQRMKNMGFLKTTELHDLTPPDTSPPTSGLHRSSSDILSASKVTPVEDPQLTQDRSRIRPSLRRRSSLEVFKQVTQKGVEPAPPTDAATSKRPRAVSLPMSSGTPIRQPSPTRRRESAGPTLVSGGRDPKEGRQDGSKTESVKARPRPDPSPAGGAQSAASATTSSPSDKPPIKSVAEPRGVTSHPGGADTPANNAEKEPPRPTRNKGATLGMSKSPQVPRSTPVENIPATTATETAARTAPIAARSEATSKSAQLTSRVPTTTTASPAPAPASTTVTPTPLSSQAVPPSSSSVPQPSRPVETITMATRPSDAAVAAAIAPPAQDRPVTTKPDAAEQSTRTKQNLTHPKGFTDLTESPYTSSSKK